ncbi:MAG TPA: hypothetical protein DEA08_05665 [Planctomycetes bacterium]|nr:hypothetical protein [Planctomycetota bacterium]
MLRNHTRQLRAFTLLELVVVLMILAALAGLVIAQVAQLGRTTDMAYSAKTSADIAENLQLHFVLNKRYPTHMDSLLIDVGADGITAAGNGVTADGVYVGAFNNAGTWTVSSGYQERGLPDSGPHLDDALVAQQLQNVSGSQGYRSFTRCGFETLMDHDERASDSNNSGVITRNLSNATADWFACINPATPAGQGYIAQLFPNSLNGTTPVLPNDVEAIVAVGLGPRSSCIPETMLNAPLYPGNDKSYYGHFVAYFACYKSGERAVLVGVSDSYGRLHRYVIEQFNESLPNNQRRG